MSAKMKAKSLKEHMSVVPGSVEDLQNMVNVLKIKLETHDSVWDVLASTENRLIVEDCTKRQRGLGLFWGAALRENEWVGANVLGSIWMQLRDRMPLYAGNVEGDLSSEGAASQEVDPVAEDLGL